MERRKKIIKIRIEINEIENQYHNRINEAQSSLKKLIKLINPWRLGALDQIICNIINMRTY